MKPPAISDLPIKGDTVIGNDVWIGQNATATLSSFAALADRAD